MLYSRGEHDPRRSYGARQRRAYPADGRLLAFCVQRHLGLVQVSAAVTEFVRRRKHACVPVPRAAIPRFAGNRLDDADQLRPSATLHEALDHRQALVRRLVIGRPDEPADKRLAMVERFVQGCRRAQLVSIIEPISRKPRDGRPWDWDAGVLSAANELGNCGADLYKAEMPLHAEGEEAAVRRICSALTRTIASPWVVLSSGVKQDNFPRAVELACGEGASGFPGRAVWRGVIGSTDLRRALQKDAAARLCRLCEIVDQTVVRR